ncbi:MAG: hypothetical protein JWO76_3392 [Nocardioides sp.]|nr:hypothetical protein [Nocardioides sp.]
MIVAAVVAIAALAAWLTAATESPTSVRRAEERRRRYVARRPGGANLGDVERRLGLQVPGHHLDFVLARFERHRIDAQTLWAWLDRFGAPALVLVLAADHGHAGLLRLLRTGTPPDLEELEVLARLSTPELFAGHHEFGTCSRLPA